MAIAAALIIWAVLNVVRFGNPFRTGHHPSFSFGGFLGFSISPWGALLLYSPVAASGLALSRGATGDKRGVVSFLPLRRSSESSTRRSTTGWVPVRTARAISFHCFP